MVIMLYGSKELETFRQCGDILGRVHGLIAQHVVPGVQLKELDAMAEEFIYSQGAKPSFKGYEGFPATLCLSLNHEVVHGIPDNRTLQQGDVLSVDCGVCYGGLHTDSAFTHGVGEVALAAQELLRVTKEALYLGVLAAREGATIGDIGFAVGQHAKKHGYGVVRDLTGHGVGHALHEEPSIPNWGKKGRGLRLRKGMVLAIEPIFNLGSSNVVQQERAWCTRDGKPSAHFEHTIYVDHQEAILLSTYQYIEAVQEAAKLTYG